MLVSELIEALSEMPPNLEVWFSTAYDSEQLSRIIKVKGTEVYGADREKEIIELIYW